MKSVMPWVVALGVLWAGTAAVLAADPAPAGKMGPKTAEFDKLFTEWKKILGELRQLREDYRKAETEKRPAMEKRYSELVKQGEAMLPKLIPAAEAAYREAPNGQLAEFLAANIFNEHCQKDDYEEALRLCKVLMDGGCNDKQILALAGFVAFCANDFDTAGKYLPIGRESNFYKQLGDEVAQLADIFATEVPYYKDAWAKEQKIREAEAKADDLPRVLLKTTKGDIELELLENEAPNTVANFIALVEKKFYNGTPFHRVLPQFMAQGGDPTGTGTGGPGYTIPDEHKQANRRVHFRGSLSMANTGMPDTGGSQFFLCFRPTRHLDGKHTVFARIVKGTEVLAKLERINPEDASKGTPDKILEAKVLRKRNHPYEPKTLPERQRG